MIKVLDIELEVQAQWKSLVILELGSGEGLESLRREELSEAESDKHVADYTSQNVCTYKDM